MALKRVALEIGMGTDIRGGDYTKAAVRALRDALWHNSLTVAGAGSTTLSGTLAKGGASSLSLTVTSTGTTTLSGTGDSLGTLTASTGAAVDSIPSMQADARPRRPTRRIPRIHGRAIASRRTSSAVPSGESSSTKIISNRTPASTRSSREASSATLARSF